MVRTHGVCQKAPSEHSAPLTAVLPWTATRAGRANGRRLIGILPGEGIGPECTGAVTQLIDVLQAAGSVSFELRRGPESAVPAGSDAPCATMEEVLDFCDQVFAEGGAILSGAFGGRFVYDFRKRLDLFCKLTPIRVPAELAQLGQMRPKHTEGVDLVLVRENASGAYLGKAHTDLDPAGRRVVSHACSYSEFEVKRILDVAAQIAASRRGEMLVVAKEGGLPELTALWCDCAKAAADEFGVNTCHCNIDFAAYRLLQEPRSFDVVVAGNLFGDMLADVTTVLLGSRALAFSGNFTPSGAGVYQTVHGASWDLAGSGRASPLGQMLAFAMLLRESFGLVGEASLVEAAVSAVLRDGHRTVDLARPGDRPVGTREMTELVATALAELCATGAP